MSVRLTKKTPQTISSTLQRATRILEFVAENQPVRAPEIQSALGMTKGSVYHVLSSLEALGYIRKDAGGYRLTFKVFAMGQTVLMRLDFVEVAKPYMRQLADSEKLNVYLSVPDGLKMVVIRQVKPRGDIQVANDFALTYDLHCSASGKLLLATMSPSRRSEIYHSLSFSKHTENTITAPNGLERDIESIKRRGYSRELMENSPYINGVAAPIFDYENQFVASFSAIGPTPVLTAEGLERVGELVSGIASEVSSSLGYTKGSFSEHSSESDPPGVRSPSPAQH